MKVPQLIRFIGMLLLCCLSFWGMGQSKPAAKQPTTLKKTPKVETFGMLLRPYKDSVAIRWTPSSYETFVLGKQFGYEIYRQVVINGVATSEPLKITDEPVKPMPEEEYLAKYSQDTIGQKAMFIVLEKETPDKSVEEAKQKSDIRMFNMTLGLLSADVYPKVATLSGLRFVDKNVTVGKTYRYEVRLAAGANKNVKAEKTITLGQTYTLPELQQVSGKGKRNMAILRWRKSYLSIYYSYYDIYRSEDPDKGYQKINKLPYVAMTSPGDDPNFATYDDSIKMVDKSYYYRIKGVTTFGDESEWSSIISVKATQSLYDSPHIIELFSLDNKTVQIVWQLDDPKTKKNVVGYVVQRTHDPLSYKYTRLNKTLLKGMDFRDPQPINSGFYRILAVGVAGDTTYSPHKMIQLEDSIPPSAPKIQEASLDSHRVVTLRWTKNHEYDFRGYVILRSYAPDEEFTRLTKGVQLDTVFRDTINTKLAYKKVYYKIHAMDNHDNASLFKTPVELKIVDREPPVPPVFTSHKVEKNKVSLTWVPSLSLDVVQTVLMRKPKYEYDWQTLLTLKGKELLTVTSYTDTALQTGTDYLYLLQATDDAGLVSSMKEVIEIKTPKGTKPLVENFRALSAPANNMVKIAWEYKEKNVSAFALYRKSAGGKSQLLKSVPGSAREFYDKWVEPSTEYTYYIQAHFNDFSQSKMAGPLVIKY